MSTTYYLSISGGADVLLVDSGGTILAYQTGSTEGPGGTTTYTISPVFDTALFDMPTDVQVWYSNDGTNFAYSPAWITSRTGDTITVTVASSTTVTAKLYYASGTVVTDENGAEVASVSTVIGGGTAPTFDGTPSASATNPTVGDSVSVLTYSASGTPTPTVTFEWFVDAVSQVETTDTFDTTGLSGGETLTCTVTASNGVSPDATANVDFGTVAAASYTVTDTYTGTTPSWTGTQWASLHLPSDNRNWTSNGVGDNSSKNEYVNVTSSCQIVLEGIELDNNAALFGNPELEVGDFVDVSIGSGPGVTVARATYNGTRTDTSDDALFEWDDGTATVAELQDGGTWGWIEGQTLTILYYDESEQ